VTDGRTVIFLHIGKTAGSTLRQILKRQFPPADVMTVRAHRRSREETLTQFASLPEAERLRPRLIMGHTVFGLHESVPRESTYITMLRNPVRLTHSQYRYVLRTPTHRHHEAASGMTLEQYVASGMAMEMDNSQTRALSGELDVPYGACTDEMLARAKRHLDDHFSWVGLTERFDESILLLRHAFGWRDVRYVSVKVARQRAELAPEDRALLERQNAFDIELYEHARGIVERRIGEADNFAAELEAFQRANARYRWSGRLTHTWPAALRRRIAR
jgi:hypothetical protein